MYYVKPKIDPHVMSVDNQTVFDLALTLDNKRIFNCLSEETAKTPVSLDSIPKAPPILQVPNVSPSVPKSADSAMRKAPDTLRPKERNHNNVNHNK